MCSSSLGRCMHTVSIFGKREFGCVLKKINVFVCFIHNIHADYISIMLMASLNVLFYEYINKNITVCGFLCVRFAHAHSRDLLNLNGAILALLQQRSDSKIVWLRILINVLLFICVKQFARDQIAPPNHKKSSSVSQVFENVVCARSVFNSLDFA